jgi:hypothetical protein
VTAPSSRRSHQQDGYLRLSAFLETAVTAIFMTGATESSLQMSCSQIYDGRGICEFVAETAGRTR